jgi:NDP-4-keto-2,6-dideoxyhexose 3-C-methyltransferase
MRDISGVSKVQNSVSACRICGNKNLATVLELGEQALTGVFPRSPTTPITKGPLTLVKCMGEQACGLLQLAHSYPLGEMYGENYGYRSGLNPSMVAHLRGKIARIEALGLLADNDIVVDIGSNDGTSLAQYTHPRLRRIGVDPTAGKFRDFYRDGIEAIEDFFSADRLRQHIGNSKAKVVTSFSMFYDLEEPLRFMEEVAGALHDDGIWVFEQSYMPLMLATNSYDTVCHEHLEYYALSQIEWMCECAGLRVVDVEQNDVNGGSFSVVVQGRRGKMPVSPTVEDMRRFELGLRLNEMGIYETFAAAVEKSRDGLLEFLRAARIQGRRTMALGASTKGNVILQYCGVTTEFVEAIGEINPDKFGAFAPGTNIPIVDEQQVFTSKPDHVLVLPWHFRRHFESQARYRNLPLVYPLPELSFT